MNLTDIYKIFYPRAEQYTCFSAAHKTFSKINYILDIKQVLINIRKLK
jgi:exonuclease III